jgi:serine/threonine protein phosphatase 1
MVLANVCFGDDTTGNNFMKYFAISDIHGYSEEFETLLYRSKFDYENDHLIFCGDFCDRGPSVVGVIDIFERIKNLTWILGNHDIWAGSFLEQKLGIKLEDRVFPPADFTLPDLWISNGGLYPYRLMKNMCISEATRIYNHLKKGIYSFTVDIGDSKYGFVHAGIPAGATFEEVDWHYKVWDRDLYFEAQYYFKSEDLISEYDLLFIGHTPTPSGKIELVSNLVMLDCGVAMKKRLGMVNIFDLEESYYEDIDK